MARRTANAIVDRIHFAQAVEVGIIDFDKPAGTGRHPLLFRS
jgi:hypothetical protein